MQLQSKITKKQQQQCKKTTKLTQTEANETKKTV